MKTLLINAARCSSAVLLSAAVLLGTVSCGPKSTTHRNPEGLVSVNYADLKQGLRLWLPAGSSPSPTTT